VLSQKGRKIVVDPEALIPGRSGFETHLQPMNVARDQRAEREPGLAR
jgi:hypothetical protein